MSSFISIHCPGRWQPDPSHRQQHIGIAVAYNVWQYYQATADWEFLAQYGAELLVEIARFWSATATYDQVRRRFVIRGVIGPDEYQWATRIRRTRAWTTAYTNVMVAGRCGGRSTRWTCSLQRRAPTWPIDCRCEPKSAADGCISAKPFWCRFMTASSATGTVRHGVHGRRTVGDSETLAVASKAITSPVIGHNAIYVFALP